MNIEDEVLMYFVTPQWVAEYYGVSSMRIHRAIRRGKIRAVKVRGPSRGYNALVIDKRLLPESCP